MGGADRQAILAGALHPPDRRVQLDVGFKSRKAAQDYAEDLESDRRRGRWLDPDGAKTSLGGWAKQWVPTLDEARTEENYRAYYRRWGDRYAIRFPLPTMAGHDRFISLSRSSGSDFTERDRLVLQLLRPHIYEIYLDSQRRRNRVPLLSRREWEVLRLAHQGCSNAAIARDLSISVAIARKHTEHIFDRTGVRTRLAAAALMMPHAASGSIRLNRGSLSES